MGKHSPEPWHQSACGLLVYGKDRVDGIASCEWVDDAARTCACVNAMEGVDDPVGFMEIVREAVGSLDDVIYERDASCFDEVKKALEAGKEIQ